ncbi:MAG: hypothetical protein KDC85_00075 [Saprospiraceae bacterium]|nr:hypothetical protein [Saprospiraceae bacterium]MCB9325589.1 hypothetical protein [Lewinellaceae bacterium]
MSLKKIRKKFYILSFCLSIAFTFQVSTPVEAQCPMCRMSAESNLKNGGSEGKGLNSGILYLLSLPYFLIGGIGYVWYRNKKKSAIEEGAPY